MSVTIRRAGYDDIEAISALFVGTVTHINARDYSTDEIQAWIRGAQDTERWKSRVVGQHFYVAETGAQLSGFASMTEDGYVDLLYVHHDLQGLQIGSRLLQTLIELGEQKGVREFTARVSITARTFFEKHGFVVREQLTADMNGVSLTNFMMAKMAGSEYVLHDQQ